MPDNNDPQTNEHEPSEVEQTGSTQPTELSSVDNQDERYLDVFTPEHIDHRIADLVVSSLTGELTVAENAELTQLLAADAQHGYDLAFNILGIRNPRELLMFQAQREVAARQAGADTILERILVDSILATKYQLDHTMMHLQLCENAIEDHVGIRYKGTPFSMDRAAQQLTRLDETRGLIEALTRNLCRYYRTLGGVKKTKVFLHVHGLQNLNIADKQIVTEAPRTGTQAPDGDDQPEATTNHRGCEALRG